MVGYQALGWGVAGALVPSMLTGNLLGATATASSNLFMRGLAWSNLALAGRFASGSDSDAATSGVLWFGMWYWALKQAVAAGTYAGTYMPMIVVWNGLMALSAVRRSGGLWNTVTNLDTSSLNSILPRDFEMSTRNFVGMQTLAWGVLGFLNPSFLFGLVGVAATPLVSALLLGNSISNTVLAGKILGGSDDEAAANGVTFFGAWGVLGALAVSKGVLTGQYAGLIAVWNLASAAFCASKIL